MSARRTAPEMGGEELRDYVEQVARQLRDDLRRLAERSSDGDSAAGDAPIHRCLDRHLARLAATGCWGREYQAVAQVLWRTAGELLEAGRLQRHAHRKPRGYAGDHVMLDLIGSETCCEDPWGAAFDRYFQRQAAPRAVRERVERVSGRIARYATENAERPLHLVSVGSGPARDVQGGLRQLAAERREGIRVTLLDLDPEALERAAERVAPWIAPDALTCVHANLSRLAGRAHYRRLLASADLLFCTGFFDYLEDAAATELLHAFWHHLSPRGLLTVYNFAPSNPSRAYMEWIGNWYLIYRNPEQLTGLARAAGIPESHVSVQSVGEGHLVELTARHV